MEVDKTISIAPSQSGIVSHDLDGPSAGGFASAFLSWVRLSAMEKTRDELERSSASSRGRSGFSPYSAAPPTTIRKLAGSGSAKR